LSKNDEPITLFLSDIKGERPIYEIWTNAQRDQIHFLIDQYITISIDRTSFFRLKEGIEIASNKLDFQDYIHKDHKDDPYHDKPNQPD